MESLPLLLSGHSGRGREQSSEMQPSMTALTHSVKSRSIGAPGRTMTENGAQASPDLRSVVGRRFMRMLRAHDRVRLETLAAYSAQPR